MPEDKREVTIKLLIEELKKYDENLPVCLYNGEYDVYTSLTSPAVDIVGEDGKEYFVVIN